MFLVSKICSILFLDCECSCAMCVYVQQTLMLAISFELFGLEL